MGSECIASMGYDSKRQELEVEYRESGDVYRCFDVSSEEHAAFMAAKSKGTYLNEVFKPKKYRYIIIKQEKRDIAHLRS